MSSDRNPQVAGLAPFIGFNANIPFATGPAADGDRKIVPDLEEAIRRTGLKDGMTISFHHAFREGEAIFFENDVLLRVFFQVGPKPSHSVEPGLLAKN